MCGRVGFEDGQHFVCNGLGLDSEYKRHGACFESHNMDPSGNPPSSTSERGEDLLPMGAPTPSRQLRVLPEQARVRREHDGVCNAQRRAALQRRRTTASQAIVVTGWLLINKEREGLLPTQLLFDARSIVPAEAGECDRRRCLIDRECDLEESAWDAKGRPVFAPWARTAGTRAAGEHQGVF